MKPRLRYRLFRLRWVNYLGSDPGEFEVGVRWDPRDRFRAGDQPFRSITITIGHREYVFDLGKAKP